MKFFGKLRSLWFRSKFEADMTEEMRVHLELQAERNRDAGMDAEAARDAAQRQFGNVASLQEQVREQRSWAGWEQLAQDVRFAARGLRRNPAFTVVAGLTLAFGIGVNTSMFTAVQSLLQRKMPYPEAGRIVQVFRTSPHSQRWPHSPANFLEQQAQNDVFTHMAAFTGRPASLAEPGQPAERVRGVLASPEMFPLLGVQPALGRVFAPGEDRPGQNRVVILDHGFWLRRFAGDPAILGRTMRLEGEAVTVVGVMPADFRDLILFGPVDVWQPLVLSDAERQNRGGNFLKSIARLKPGVTLGQAQAAMDVLAAKQAREHPDTNSEIGLRIVTLADAIDPRGRILLWLTMALAGFVLLIACANLANLQFARTARRAHEFAIRGALGAARGRLLRLLLTESLLIAALGGLGGIVLAAWGNEVLARQISVDSEQVLILPLSFRMIGFAFCAAALSGLAFGLVPAWLASRTDVNEALKQGSRGTTGDRSRHRLQHALIVAEVALALVLLAGAGLVMGGLRHFTQMNPGWRVEGLTLSYLNLPEAKYGSEAARAAFAAQLQEKLRGLPGVERVALAWSLPLSGFSVAGDFKIDGQRPPAPGREPLRFVNGVTPDYFATLGMRLVAGRAFDATDTSGQPGRVIINEAMARAFWPRESALGQRVDGEEIVGVVSDVRFPADPSEPQTRFQTYRPFAQAPRDFLGVAIRGTVSADVLRQAVAELDSDLPLHEPGLARDAVDKIIGRFVLVGRLLVGFALLGLLLASLGIYGVIAGFVVQRTNEIGLRMALGAQVGDVLWLVIGQGLRLTLLGAAIGLLGALGIGRVLATVLPALDANDPLLVAGMAVFLVAVAMTACWLPARRAAKVDPVIALRAE